MTNTRNLRTIIIPLVMLTLLLAGGASSRLFALGSREKGAESTPTGARTEETRRVELYILVDSPTGAAVSSASGESAAAALFRPFSKSGGATEITGSRRFSMPIVKRESLPIRGDIALLKMEIDLTPAEAISYSRPETVSVRFTADDLLSGDRIRLQPAQQALLAALGKSSVDQGLIRIARLHYDGKGEFRAEIEIAERR